MSSSPKQQIKATEKQLIHLQEEYDKKINVLKKKFLKKGELMNADNKKLRDQLTQLKTDLAIKENELMTQITDLKSQVYGSKQGSHHENQALKEKLSKQLRSCEGDFKMIENKLMQSEDLLKMDAQSIQELKHRIHVLQGELDGARSKSKLSHQDDTIQVLVKKACHDKMEELKECDRMSKDLLVKMERDSQEHVETRLKYETLQNQVLALKQSLHQTEVDKMTAVEIAEQYQAKYHKLEESSQKELAELRHRLHEEVKKYQEDLNRAERKIEKRNFKWESSPSRLETCHEIIVESKKYQDKIRKLEGHISEMMHHISSRRLAPGETYDIKYHPNVEQLKAELQQVLDENRHMADKLQQIKQEDKIDVEDTKMKLDDIVGRYRQNRKELEHCIQDRAHKESQLMKAGEVISALEKEKKHVENRLVKEEYQDGKEKDTLENRLLDVINERDKIKMALEVEGQKHALIHDKVNQLNKENSDLKVLRRKYEEDLDNLSKLAAQSSEAQAQLTKSQLVIEKKNNQLKTLADQLAQLIERNKYLYQKELELKQRLEQSVSEEESDKINKRLLLCRNQLQEINGKYSQMHAIALELKKQNMLNDHKITSLVDLLKTSDLAKEELNKERKVRVELEEALKKCQDVKLDKTKELEMKLMSMEDQYKQSIVKHTQDVEESNARIKQLQLKYDVLRQPNVQGQPKEKFNKAMKLPLNEEDETRLGATRLQNLAATKNRLDEEQTKLSMAMDALQKQLNGSSVPQQSSQLQQQRLYQNNQLQSKETELMKTRQQTYDELLQALIQSKQQNGQQKNTNIYDQIDTIRKRGQQREQEKLADLLQLRAVSQKTETEYRQARKLEADYLNKISNLSRQDIMRGMMTKPSTQGNGQPTPTSQFYTSQLSQPVTTHNAIVNAQAAHYNVTKSDALQELANIQKYQGELQHALNKMTTLEKQVSVEVNKGSNIDKLKYQLEKDQQATLKALSSNQNAQTGEERYINSVESKLQALLETNNTLIKDIKDFVKSPSKETGILAGTSLTTSPEELSAKIDFNRKLDQSLNTTFILPGNDDLKYDTTRGLLYGKNGEIASADYITDKNNANAWQLSKQRAMRSLDKYNYVLVTYSYETFNKTQDMSSARRAIFRNALEEIYPAIENKPEINLQMVELLPGQARDLISKTNLDDGDCKTSAGSCHKIKNGNMQELFDYIATALPKTTPSDPSSHVVLSLSLPNHKTKLHIVDVFYADNASAFELFDVIWVNYLKPVMQLSTTKLDLIFALLPSKDMDSNQRQIKMIQLSIRLQAFLKQLDLFKKNRKLT